MNYPRVLIISPDSLSSPNGTGLTLTSLFAGWPPGRLANLYYCGEPPPRSVCAHGWQIRPKNLVARIAAKAAREILRNAGNDIVTGLDAEGGRGRWQVLWGTTFQAIAQLATPGLNREDLEHIERFKPDVVYSLLWSLTGMKVTEQASQRTGTPVVPHFMDDWPSTTYQQAILGPVWRMILLRRLRRVLRRAPLGLAICEDMADELRRRYDLPFTPFMRCVDASHELSRPLPESGTPRRLIYTGGLHLGRAQVLAVVASGMDRLSATGTECFLTVHSPRDQEHARFIRVLGDSDRVRWGEVLPAELVDETLTRADVAVHVESFDPRATAYTRLSLSTKFPSYLAAGLPILAVGPPTIASIRYVERHGIGLSVTRPDPAEIAFCLQKLGDRNVWSGFADRAQNLYREQHCAPDVRRRFAFCLEKVAGSRPSI